MKPVWFLVLLLTVALLYGCAPKPPAEILVTKPGDFVLAPGLTLRVFADEKSMTCFSLARSSTTSEGLPETITTTLGTRIVPGELFALCWQSSNKQLYLATAEIFLFYDLSKPRETKKTCCSLEQVQSAADLPASLRAAIDRAFPR